MEPLFKNATTYTLKNYEEFLQFHSKKFNFSYNMYNFIMILLLLYCVILNVFQKNLILFLFFLLLLFGFLWWRIVLPISKYKKLYRQLKTDKQKKQTFEFDFYNNFFILNKTRFYYLKLYKVFETKDYFYLYVDDTNAALISKNGFKDNKTPEEFSQFIRKKSIFKYSKQM